MARVLLKLRIEMRDLPGEGQSFSRGSWSRDRGLRSRSIVGAVEVPGHQGEVGVIPWTIGLVLVVAWLMGLVTGYTLRGFVHLLPVFAVLIVAVAAIGRGRSRARRSA
jgi:hypothetical protein